MAIVDGVQFSAGDVFTNFGGNLSVQTERLFYPKTLADLQVIVREANKNKKKVRCVGSGHSWSATAVTTDYQVSVNSMNKIHAPVQATDGSGWTVTLETGVLVSELDTFLRAHNPPLALPSNVVPDVVSVLFVFICLICLFQLP
jgi:FAD/FMN-containing dehydrogenase